MVCYVSRCCGCISLRNGTLIIAVVLTVCSAASLVFLASTIQQFQNDLEYQGSTPTTMTPTTNSTISVNYTLTVGYVSIATVSVSLFFSLMLLIGTLREVPVLLLGWVIYASVCAVIQIVGGIFDVVNTVGVGVTILTLFILLVGILIQFHFILVVKSYMQELNEMRSVLCSSSQLFACDAMKQPDFYPCHPPPYISYDATSQPVTVMH